MVLAMYVGMLIYMPLQSLLPAEVQPIGMALFMAWPMVVWMRIRGHAWRHGFEMAAAMLVPWVALAAAARLIPSLAPLSELAMYAGMLVYMLFRREHYLGGAAHAHAAQPVRARSRRIPWRRALLVAAYLLAILLVPPVVIGANYYHKLTADLEPHAAPAYAGELPAPAPPDPAKKIAIVVSGPRGSEIGDTLEAYEILARSGAFNVYSVAPERTPLPLMPGFAFGASSLDFVPHFSFAEYDAQIGRQPDLIAIPWFDGNYSPEQDSATLDWIRARFGANTTILAICSGNEILADTGLLAGHTATTNTGTFDYVQSHSPTTRWLRNVRYVDDGSLVTSTNLTAGIDATLHVVDRFAGRATALDVARQIGYSQTGALDNPAFDAPDASAFLAPISINSGLEGPKQPVGVLLYDGVTELGLSGLVDPLEGTASVRTFVAAPQRRIIRSRDGFLFLPRYDFSNVPSVDRVLLPAGENDTAKQQVIAAWSAQTPAEDIYAAVGSGRSAYDVSFADIAQQHNGSLARAMASGLFYSAAPRDFANANWPVSEAVALIALMLLAAGAVWVVAVSCSGALRRVYRPRLRRGDDAHPGHPEPPVVARGVVGPRAAAGS
jgi:transcriptional regulator GlxA family with amidase domain